MRPSSRLLALAAVVGTLGACSSSPTGPCSTFVKGMLIGRLEYIDHATGCLDSVDSLYANPAVLADTFRVCGFDTTRISVAERKFVTTLPPRCA